MTGQSFACSHARGQLWKQRAGAFSSLNLAEQDLNFDGRGKPKGSPRSRLSRYSWSSVGKIGRVGNWANRGHKARADGQRETAPFGHRATHHGPEGPLMFGFPRLLARSATIPPVPARSVMPCKALQGESGPPWTVSDSNLEGPTFGALASGAEPFAWFDGRPRCSP